MTQLPSQSQFGDYGAWPGGDVLDSSGERLGDVREIYLDRDTGLPEWVLVEVEGGGARFVPLADAEVQSDTIRVAHSRSVVDQAPRIGDDPRIDERQEEELYDHYGIRTSEDASSSVLPVEEPAPEPRADGDSPAPSGGEP